MGETFVDEYIASYQVGAKALAKLQNDGVELKAYSEREKAIYRLYPTPELGYRECSIMRKLNCEYLQKLYNYDSSVSSHLSIWENYNLSLDRKLRYNVDQLKIEVFLRQVLCGLKYMHDNKFVHGDLTVSKIIVTKHNVAKISDFRLSETKNHSNSKHDLKMLGELYNQCMRIDYRSYKGSLHNKNDHRCTLLRLLYLRLLNGRITLADALKSPAFAGPKDHINAIRNICKKNGKTQGTSSKAKIV